MKRKYIHEKIRERRRIMRLTQQELAQKTGTTREHIAEIERGRITPKVTTLSKIANALGVRESHFFDEGGGENE